MTPEEARAALKAITDDVKSKLDDFCKSIVNDREQLKNEYCDCLMYVLISIDFALLFQTIVNDPGLFAFFLESLHQSANKNTTASTWAVSFISDLTSFYLLFRRSWYRGAFDE